MAYLSYEEFLTYPLGVTVTELEFSTLEYYAEKQIDAITHGHINKDAYPTEVKEAVALQVAYLVQNGGINMALGGTTLASENLGGYSYSTTSGNGHASTLCPVVRDVLWPTGLLFAGVGGMPSDQ